MGRAHAYSSLRDLPCEPDYTGAFVPRGLPNGPILSDIKTFRQVTDCLQVYPQYIQYDTVSILLKRIVSRLRGGLPER